MNWTYLTIQHNTIEGLFGYHSFQITEKLNYHHPVPEGEPICASCFGLLTSVIMPLWRTLFMAHTHVLCLTGTPPPPPSIWHHGWPQRLRVFEVSDSTAACLFQWCNRSGSAPELWTWIMRPSFSTVHLGWVSKGSKTWTWSQSWMYSIDFVGCNWGRRHIATPQVIQHEDYTSTCLLLSCLGPPLVS